MIYLIILGVIFWMFLGVIGTYWTFISIWGDDPNQESFLSLVRIRGLIVLSLLGPITLFVEWRCCRNEKKNKV
jgi:hypothetical protein